ncbi:MAG TPA: SRPBCC domain-containing protein [Nitrososphaera sp.]|nr:SRPBCC domain-containing protein [Nitrososphaera sp.]
MKDVIAVQTVIHAPIAKVWECWTKPMHIRAWAFASDDWEAPAAENDLRLDGRFRTVMAAKDKSTSFEFAGTYTTVNENRLIEYDLDDGRHVKVEFASSPPNDVLLTETFEPESENSLEMQRSGWQAILDNFKKYVENHTGQSR